MQAGQRGFTGDQISKQASPHGGPGFDLPRAVLDAMTDGISIVDRDGVLCEVNRALVEMTGFSREELIGSRPPFPYWSEESREEIHTSLERTMRGIIDHYQLVYRRKDESRFPVIVSPTAVRNENGDVQYFMAAIKDITALVENSGQYRESHRRYSAMLDDMPDFVMRWNGDGNRTYVNRSYCQFFGRLPEQLLGTSFYHEILPDDLPGVVGKIERLSPENPVEVDIRRIRLPDGEIAWQEWTDRAIFAGPRVVEYQSVGRDISERKRIEDALRHSEAKLKSIVETAPVLIALVDKELQIQFVNHYVSGLSAEGVIGRSMLDFVLSDFHEVLGTSARSAAETAQPVEFELKGAGPDGSVVWYTSRIQATFRGDELDGFVLVTSDISERVRQFRALEKSDERLRAAIQGRLDGFCMLEVVRDGSGTAVDFRPIDANTNLQQTLRDGLSILDAPVSEWKFRFEGFDLAQTMDAAFKSGVSLEREFQARGGPIHDGWYYCQVVPYREGVVLLLRDINDRKLVEQERERVRQRFETLLFEMPVLLLACDDRGRIVFWNRACQRVTGFSEDEVDSTADALAILQPNAGAQSSLRILSASGEADFFDREIRMLARDGTPRLVSWTNISRQCPLEGWGDWAVGVDMTDREKAELEKGQLEGRLRHSQKLEAIGTLAGGVAHEINNPLMGMINFAELVQQSAGEERIRGFADEIVREGERIAEIVRGLLTFARRDTMTFVDADPMGIVQAAAGLIRTQLERDRIRLQLSFEPRLPTLRCSPVHLQQVLLNLMNNARFALHLAGRHSVPRIQVIVRSTKRSTIEFVVEDNGPGIPPELQESIFEPFVGEKRAGHSSGMGLAVSYGIVQEHGGSLNVQSDVGNWTRFVVELPLPSS